MDLGQNNRHDVAAGGLPQPVHSHVGLSTGVQERSDVTGLLTADIPQFAITASEDQNGIRVVDIVRFSFKLDDVIDNESLTRVTTLLGAKRPGNRKTLSIQDSGERLRYIPRGPLSGACRNHRLTLIVTLSDSTSVSRFFPLGSGFCPSVLGKHSLDRESESVQLLLP